MSTVVKSTRPIVFSGIAEELKKVSWPSKQDTFRLTAVVIIISLIVGLYIGIIDVLFAKILELATGR